MSNSVTNYNYVGDTKISVSIKKLMPIFLYYVISLYLFDDKLLLYIKKFNK